MIKLHPSAELHLLRGMSVDVELAFNNFDTNVWELINNPLGLGPFTLATIANRTITAHASNMGTERDFLQIQDPGGATLLEVPIQISVHETILRVWCSHARHTVEVGSPDRVLVVYAEFRDSTGASVVAEVTGRRFLKYDPVTPSGGLTVDPDGRLVVPITPGTWTVTIRVDPTLPLTPTPISDSVVIEAVPVPGDLPILVKQHEGTEVRRKSIVFIAEGWTAEMEDLFYLVCKWIARRLKVVQPYRRLAESLDIYSAFVPSAEEGITIGADVLVSPVVPDRAFVLMPDGSLLKEVVLRAGHPDDLGAPTTLAGLRAAATMPELSQQIFDLWMLLDDAERTRVRDTAWGLTITYPQHGAYTHVQLPTGPDRESWLSYSVLPRGPARAPFFPDHRLPPLTGASFRDPATAHVDRLFDFVSKLRPPDSPAPVPGGPRFGERWGPGGDSEGMVVLLAWSDVHGGVCIEGDQQNPMTFTIVTTGREPLIGVAPAATSLIPGFREVVPASTSTLDAPTLRRMADVVAHELAHTPMMGRLHDEYGGQVMPSPVHAWIPPFVDDRPNTHMLADVLDGAGPELDPTKLKWRWPRVRAGATVEQMTVDGTDVVFLLSLSHALRWPKSPAGRPVWLRRGPLWPKKAARPPLPNTSNPLELTLVSYDSQQQLVRCTPPAGVAPADVVTSFWGTPGPLNTPTDIRIVLQRVDDAGTPLWLINDEIAAALDADDPANPNDPPVGGPLTTSLNCTDDIDQDRRAWVESLRVRTPAAYEGGAGFYCHTVRPAIECKLHRLMEPVGTVIKTMWVERFCVVCQYVMTYQVDVSLLPKVDKQLDVVPRPL